MKSPSVTAALLFLLALTLLAAAPQKDSKEVNSSEAARLNNLGCAYMNQQLFEKALKSFEESSRLDPKLAVARAYQQSGDTTEARKHLTRFQYVTQNKLGTTMSLAYGEQGKYSRAEESAAAPEHVPPAMKVEFVDVTQKAGLATQSAPGQAED